MKSRFVAFVGVFCIAILIVSVADAGKPVKPPKPGGTTTEWIEFMGALDGGEAVAGCCPNNGPWPAYSMTLSGLGDLRNGTHDGQLFINYYGAGRNQKYIVQFWTEDFGIEIIGGEIEREKKTKVLTVTFTNEICSDLDSGDPIAVVSFTLVRTPL
jgi:hypothetical protein